MDIEVLNWDKYQSRKDLKSLKWFRLDADLIYSQSLFGLTPSEKWFFIFILGSCAKHNSNILKLDASYASHNSGLKNDEIKNAIFKLQENQLIKCSSVEIRTNPYESVRIRTNSCPTNITNNTYIHNKHNIHNKTIQVKKVERSGATEITPGSEIWMAYAKAYAIKYKTEPIRNSKTNTICKRLFEAVGKEKAIELVKHYLTINDQWYLKNYHKIETCLSDYQKILTSFETGLKITTSKAYDLEKKQNTRDAFDNVIKEYEIIYEKSNADVKTNG